MDKIKNTASLTLYFLLVLLAPSVPTTTYKTFTIDVNLLKIGKNEDYFASKVL